MLTDMNFPRSLKYSTDRDSKPFHFYNDCLKNSISLDLHLGYFSTNAICTLALGFSRFISNSGKLRIITNQFLKKEDIDLISPDNVLNDSEKLYISTRVKDELQLVEILNKSEKHFYNCLRYLVENDRLIIQPVIMKSGGMSHFKSGVFSDGVNKIQFDGSCNFTTNGILINGESIIASRSWGTSEEIERINEEIEKFNKVITGNDSYSKLLKKDDLIEVIYSESNSKELNELINDEINILEDYYDLDISIKSYIERELSDIKKISNSPYFPFAKPRDYQIEANSRWIANSNKGILAMATGTGKTITSLNMAVEFFKNKYHKIVILVPTKELIKQWYGEVNNFNFTNITCISSDYNWKVDLKNLSFNIGYADFSFVIIATYSSLSNDLFLDTLNKISSDILLICDEMHNLGASNKFSRIKNICFNSLIGLSATPERHYDTEGTKKLFKFFNDSPPYTYSFSMKRAIQEGILASYYYYPITVELTDEEMIDYNEITKKIIKVREVDNELLNILLLKRKRIINRAINKDRELIKIIDKCIKSGKDKHILLYSTEGSDKNNNLIIDKHAANIKKVYPNLKLNKITSKISNRQEVLKHFEDGKINIIASMKCLDEGVDIPKAKTAIFTSSTGNPRQFIQRRGRVLRKYKNEIAHIYDLIVHPKKTSSFISTTEKTIVLNELRRYFDFSKTAINAEDCEELLLSLISNFNLSLGEIYE